MQVPQHKTKLLAKEGEFQVVSHRNRTEKKSPNPCLFISRTIDILRLPHLHISRSQILKNAKYRISEHQASEHTGTPKLKDALGNASCSCWLTSIATASKSATLDWHLLSLTTRIYHIMVPRNGRAVSSCTLFHSRYLMGMLFYARALINSQQKLLTTFVFRL